ncbi:hypothetical protein KQI84_14160 [bacterium]|nr:hypothetical protein [bacterium]
MAVCARRVPVGRVIRSWYLIVFCLLLTLSTAAQTLHPDDVYWDDRFAPPGVAGTVHVVETDGSNIYIGGEFNAVCGVRANNVAKWNGSSWSALWTGTNGPVYAIDVAPDGSAYIGGYFTEAGGISVNHIARWGGNSWSKLGVGDDNGVHPDGSVRSIYARGNSEIYVGGGFSRVAGSIVTAMNIALWNGQQWSALDWGVANSSMGGGEVNCMVDMGGSIYVGGGFSVAGSTYENGFMDVAQWNGTSWSKLGGGVGGYAHAMTEYQGNLVVTGLFYSAGRTDVGNIASWNPTLQTWSPIGDTGTFQDTLRAAKVIGGDLYVAGDSDFNGLTFKYWDGATWNPVNVQIRGDRNGDPLIYSIATNGNNRVYFGGSFRTDTLFHENLAGFGEVTGNTSVVLVGNYDDMWATGHANGLDGIVHAFEATSDGSVYAGGEFMNGSGQTLNRLARWTGTSWEPVGGGVNNTVEALHASGTDLYVGGQFTQAGGVSCEHVARWDGNEWHPLGLGLSGTVLSIGSVGDTVFCGGSWLYAGNEEIHYIARWENGTWSSLASGVDNTVMAMERHNNDLYVGGSFTQAGVYTANYAAVWGANYWSTLSPGPIIGLNNVVYEMAESPDWIILGGEFTEAGGSVANHVVAWNGIGWVRLGDGIGNSTYENVRAVTANDDNEVFVGGTISTFVNDYSAYPNRIAKYASSSWSILGSGVSGGEYLFVDALEVGAGGEVFVGGDFTAAGNKGSMFVGAWLGSLSPQKQTATVLVGNLPDPGDLDRNSDGLVDVSDIVKSGV